MALIDCNFFSEVLGLSCSMPALYACGGTADLLIGGNREFVAHAKKIGLSLDCEEHLGADHEWAY